MRRPSRRVPALALGATLILLGLSGVEARALTPRLVVTRPVPVPAGDAVVATAMTASFDVVLAQPRQAALTAFLAGLTSPMSPYYREFLTPAQFARDFGAPVSAIAAVRDYLRGYGLRVLSVSAGRVVMRVRGPSGAIARAFAAPVATVRTAHGLAAQFTGPATLPAPVARLVRTVVGLSTVNGETPVSLARRAHVTTAGSCPSAGSSSSNGPNALGGYTLNQQANLYGFAGPWAKGDTGVGQTIAVYELAPYSSGDVNAFFSCYSVSPSVTNVLVDGGSSSPNDLEPTFDVEEAAALAPGAAIRVYIGPNNATGPTDVLARIADDNAASIVSTSWGTCESDPTNDPTGEQPLFEQMAAQGQTVFAAAGDAGSSDCTGVTNNSPAVDDPASQPFVTGVGGLTVSGISPLAQTVWNDGIGSGGGAAGGGASAIWSRPAWQNAPGITAGEAMRMVPDLSVMADPATGFIDYFTGNPDGSCGAGCAGAWSAIGGTSVGPPLMSALTAVGAQACGVGRLGFLNPTFYAMARRGTGFSDVTAGTNDLFGVGVYSAGPGYDMASGLGSPAPATFLAGLCPVALDPSHSSLTPATPSASTASSVGFAFAARDAQGNAIPGAVIHFTASAASGVVEFDATGASVKGPGAAAYDVTTDAQGDATVSLTSTAPGPVTVDAANGTATLSTSVTFTALATRAPGRASITQITSRVAGFTLTAGAPSSVGSAALTGYQYSVNAGRSWVRFSVVTRTVTVRRLARAATYRVTVRALNAYGAGPPSAPARVRTR
ncbi:MAG: protease pro-enzyme activation domain-containing protein [Acidimicrobiales bacterium]